MANQQNNNNNLNNGIPLPPNAKPNLMNQPQIPPHQMPYNLSPQTMNIMSHQSPMPTGVPINYSGSPIAGPVFQTIPPSAQLSVISPISRPQQQGSPYINIQPQQSPPTTSPASQPKKSGSSKKQNDGVETHVTRLGLAKILYVSNIQVNTFINYMASFEKKTHTTMSEEAKCTIALALKYRMIEAVKQSIAYSQKRRLTLLPTNIYYTDFPIAQFAKLEVERRILASNTPIKPTQTANTTSLIDSFNFGFQGPPLTQKPPSFFQSTQNQNQDNDPLNDNNEPSSSADIKPNNNDRNLTETSSAAVILEQFRNDVLYGVAARVYGKKREEVTNLIGDQEDSQTIGDQEEKQPILDQTPLKKLLPEIEKNQNVVIEDVYQYVEGSDIIPAKSRSRRIFNLQFRKVDSNTRKNPR